MFVQFPNATLFPSNGNTFAAYLKEASSCQHINRILPLTSQLRHRAPRLLQRLLLRRAHLSPGIRSSTSRRPIHAISSSDNQVRGRTHTRCISNGASTIGDLVELVPALCDGATSFLEGLLFYRAFLRTRVRSNASRRPVSAVSSSDD